jgi:hypothetical protein
MEHSVENSSPQATANISASGTFCMHCGQRNLAGASFCSACGQTTGSAPSADAQATEEVHGGIAPLKLRYAFLYYVASLGVTALAVVVYPALTPFVYLICGFVMTKVVMSRLIEWHPVYNTLHNQVSAKLGMVALWPFQMLSLLFKLGINRAL